MPPPPDDGPPPWETATPEGVTDADRRAISTIESGGRYDRLGPRTRSGDRAFGKYQVMGRNVGDWTEQALGRRLTPDEFLSDPDAQEATFAHRFGNYKSKYGGEGAARAWFAGEGGMNRLNSTDVLGTSVGRYGNMYNKLAGAETPRPTGPAPGVGSTDERRQLAPDDGPPPWGEETVAAPPSGQATAMQALERGYYKTKGMVGGAIEALGEGVGKQETIDIGKRLREQAEQDVKSYPEQSQFLKIRSAADALQYGKETVLDFVPQIGASATGAAIGGLLGGPPGALAGAGLASLIMNTGDIQSQLKEKDANAVAPGFVAAGGTAAAALDLITPFRLGSKLLMKFGKETGEEIAKKTLQRSAAKEIGIETGKSAGVEGVTEALQEVIGEYAVSGALDKPPDWSELPTRMIEAGAAGALGGGVFGGGAQAFAAVVKPGKATVPGGDTKPPGGELPGEPPPPPPPGAPPPDGGAPPWEPPPGGFPAAPLPVGVWEENVPQDVVKFLPGVLPWGQSATEAGGELPPGTAIPLYREGEAPPPEGIYTESQQQQASAAESLQVPGRAPNWYYTTVRDAAVEKLPSFGSPQQMLATLQNTPGVKRAEIDATGIGEWLAKQTGKISKKDVISEIEARSVNVETITKKGPPTPERLTFNMATPNPAGGTIWMPDQSDPEAQEWAILVNAPETEYVVTRRRRPLQFFSDLADAEDFVQDRRTRDRRTGTETQYDDPAYTLSGGKNYQENLITMARKPKTATQKERDMITVRELDRIQAIASREWTREERQFWHNHSDQYEQLAGDLQESELPFRHGHWRAHDDVVGWTRTKDRMMTDGKSTLHVDEAQSDWGQKAHEFGVITQAEAQAFANADVEAAAKILELRQQLRPLHNREAEITADLDILIEQQMALNTRGDFTGALEISKVADELWQERIQVREQQDEIGDQIHIVQHEFQEQRFKNENKVPDFPFKTSWAELLFKRALYMAAEKGMDRMSWTPAPIQNVRWERDPDEGSNKLYSQYWPRLAQKYTKMFPEGRFAHGFLADTVTGPGSTRMDRMAKTTEIPFFEMTQRTRDAILGKGFSLFSQFRDERPGEAKNEVGFTQATTPTADPWQVGTIKDARPQIKEAAEVVWRVARKLGITKPIEIRVVPDLPKGSMAHVWGFDKDGRPINILRSREPASYVIEIATTKHTTIEEMYASLSHEVGHIVQAEFYTHNASPLLKAQLDERYEAHLRERKNAGVKTFGDLMKLRDNFLVNWYDMRSPPGARTPPGSPVFSDTPLSDFPPDRREYWLGFEEWFAEQVARHFTTSQPVLNAVDRFFKNLATRMRAIYEAFKQQLGLTATPDQWIAGWLDSRLTEAPLVAAASEANRNGLADANDRAMAASGVQDYPRADLSVTSIPGRKVIASVGETIESRAAAAAADRFNGFYRWMLSVAQVAARNLHIQPLQRYVELWQQKQLERAQMMSQAVETLRQWRNLGRKQADAVSTMLDAYMNLEYLSGAEVQMGIMRRPTEAEVQKLARDAGANEAAVKIFRRIQDDFDSVLLRYEGLLRQEALRITDMVARTRRLREISEHITRLRNTPYAPAMRFGDLVIVIKDADGNVVSRYHFETEGQRKRAEKSLRAAMKPGETLEKTAIPDQAKPFLGLPPGLLELIAEKLSLTDVQRKALNELKYEFAPAHGFQHRFQRKSKTPGYSQDFFRAYANYFFHGSNYFTNVKYVQPLRDEIGLVKLSAEGLGDGTKRIQIHNFMNEHLNYMLDPAPDFAHLRGLMFHWGLGFSPAAAFVNLSQMALGSYPFLAGKFGDASTIAAMTRAGTNLSSYYRRGTIAGLTAERDMRALNEAVRQGVITEAMAPELAGLTEQDNIRKGYSHVSEMARIFAEMSAFMFQTTEQVNRRVTFRAAWQLALDNPYSTYVTEMKDKHSLQYQSLVDQGWNEQEAAAFVVAKDAVESTQFIYHQWANPKFMRGRARTAFIFKNFMQNTLFMLWHYKEARIRALLVFAFLGGMMGLPGADDMKNLIKAIGWRLFGKDWDVEQEARKMVQHLTDGKISPDLLLHGASRYSFGANAAMALMGVPFPAIDMSRSIGLGRLLPVNPNTLFGQHASKDPKGAIADATTQALGYAFQVNANFYNALVDSQMGFDSMQRWQKAMPRALAGLSKAYQAAPWNPDPALRTRTGSAVVRFDPTDSAQMMEVLAMAGGFQPTRVTAKWDLIMAQREAQEFWNLKREGLLRQLFQARQTDDDENYSRALQAIRDFNENLPDEARPKAITADNIRQSLKSRITGITKQEIGIPAAVKDIPLVRSIQELYPEAEVDVRRVR